MTLGPQKPKKVLTARERQRARVGIHWKFEHVECTFSINGHPGREKGASLGWPSALKYPPSLDLETTTDEWQQWDLRQRAQRRDKKKETQEEQLGSIWLLWPASAENGPTQMGFCFLPMPASRTCEHSLSHFPAPTAPHTSSPCHVLKYPAWS